MIQDRLEMGPPSHLARAIVVEHRWIDVELLRQKGDGVRWSHLEVRWTKTEIAHGAKLERHV
jgi:hypothetical protein